MYIKIWFIIDFLELKSLEINIKKIQSRFKLWFYFIYVSEVIETIFFNSKSINIGVCSIVYLI